MHGLGFTGLILICQNDGAPVGIFLLPDPLGYDDIRLMIKILHYLKDPKLWELWYIPYYG